MSDVVPDLMLYVNSRFEHFDPVTGYKKNNMLAQAWIACPLKTYVRWRKVCVCEFNELLDWNIPLQFLFVHLPPSRSSQSHKFIAPANWCCTMFSLSSLGCISVIRRIPDRYVMGCGAVKRPRPHQFDRRQILIGFRDCIPFGLITGVRKDTTVKVYWSCDNVEW